MSRLDRISDWKQRARRANYCIEKLASSVHVTMRHLERYFQKAGETSPKAWIDELRMEDASRLLRRGIPIKVVAARVGYKYPEHFTRAFERVKGVAPSVFFGVNGSTPDKCRKLAGNVGKRQVIPIATLGSDLANRRTQIGKSL